MSGKKMSRFLSLVIALIMVFSIIPMQSFAAVKSELASQELPKVQIEALQNAELTLNKAVDEKWDYEGFKKDIFEKVLRVTGVPSLTYSDFKYEYKILNGLGVDDGILSGLYYDVATENISQDAGHTYRYLYKGGQFTVKVSIPTSSNYEGAEVVFKLKVKTADPYKYDIALKPNYQKDFTLGYNKAGKLDYEKLRQDIFNAVVDTTKYTDIVKYENAKITYQLLNDLGVDDGILSGHYYDFEQGHIDADKGGTYRYLYKGGNFNVKIAFPATENRRAAEKIVNVNVNIDKRTTSNIILNDVDTVYSKDTAKLKDAIFNSIAQFNSKLPEGVTKDDFIFQYKARVILGGGTPGANYEWSPLEGGNGPASTYYNQIGIGQHDIRVKYRGNEKYEPSDWAYAKITVNPLSTEVTFSQNSVYFDEKLPKDYVKPSVNDKFNIFEIFTGIKGNDATIYIDAPQGLNATADFAANIPFNDVLLKIFGINTILSADEIYYRRGLSRDELVTLLSNDLFRDYVRKTHKIDAAACDTFLNEVNALPQNVNHIWFKIGKPTTPAKYRAMGIAASANYKTAVATQDFNVKFHSKGVRLQWMQNTSELNVISAKKFDYTAVVTKNGCVVDSSHVKYIYTGFTLKGRFYASTTTPPREAGIFTQTAYTGIKGRYAFPKTRTFIIGL